MRRTRSRQNGRSVVSGATTPNRNGLVPRVAVVSGIVPVLSFDLGLPPASFAIYERVRRFRQHGAESSGRGVDSGGRVRGVVSGAPHPPDPVGRDARVRFGCLTGGVLGRTQTCRVGR